MLILVLNTPSFLALYAHQATIREKPVQSNPSYQATVMRGKPVQSNLIIRSLWWEANLYSQTCLSDHCDERRQTCTVKPVLSGHCDHRPTSYSQTCLIRSLWWEANLYSQTCLIRPLWSQANLIQSNLSYQITVMRGKPVQSNLSYQATVIRC